MAWSKAFMLTAGAAKDLCYDLSTLRGNEHDLL